MAIMRGFPSEYDILVEMVNNKLQGYELTGSEISIQEVLAMALSQESRIKHLACSVDNHVHAAIVKHVEARGYGKGDGGPGKPWERRHDLKTRRSGPFPIFQSQLARSRPLLRMRPSAYDNAMICDEPCS